MTMKDAIKKLQSRQELGAEAMNAVMELIMSGAAEHGDIVSFLVALRDKGETVGEIAAAAEVMRSHATPFPHDMSGLVDTCGTGGDQKGTFNISTAAAFVVAGADVPVAKHGNRSQSSRCGSADVLEALGVAIDLGPERVEHCLRDAGIGFFFAPRYHPATKNVAMARKEIGTRTIFNLLGPLTNPAGARRQLIGVYSADWCEPLAQVLARLGSEHVMVVHGYDGMDEITLTAKTKVAELKDGHVDCYDIAPEDLDLKRCQPEELLGEGIEGNAHQMRAILEGFVSPLRDAVLLNAAAALVVAGRAANFIDGIEVAERSLDQGHAYERLKKLIEVSNG